MCGQTAHSCTCTYIRVVRIRLSLFFYFCCCRPPSFKQVTPSSRTNVRQLLSREQCLQRENRERQQQQQPQKSPTPTATTAEGSPVSHAIPIQQHQTASTPIGGARAKVPPQVLKASVEFLNAIRPFLAAFIVCVHAVPYKRCGRATSLPSPVCPPSFSSFSLFSLLPGKWFFSLCAANEEQHRSPSKRRVCASPNAGLFPSVFGAIFPLPPPPPPPLPRSLGTASLGHSLSVPMPNRFPREE